MKTKAGCKSEGFEFHERSSDKHLIGGVRHNLKRDTMKPCRFGKIVFAFDIDLLLVLIVDMSHMWHHTYRSLFRRDRIDRRWVVILNHFAWLCPNFSLLDGVGTGPAAFTFRSVSTGSSDAPDVARHDGRDPKPGWTRSLSSQPTRKLLEAMRDDSSTSGPTTPTDCRANEWESGENGAVRCLSGGLDRAESMQSSLQADTGACHRLAGMLSVHVDEQPGELIRFQVSLS